MLCYNLYMRPSFLNFSLSQLEKIRDSLWRKLKSCTLCPRECKVDRTKGELGFCKTGRFARVCSFHLHFGEEPELVGRGGSGTIFFSYCNLGCIYCQNYTISHLGEGHQVSPEELARIMLYLQRSGAENINLVTPTHVLPQIIEALILAIEEGLKLVLVYNCGGYESPATLKTVEGLFDIYMPDLKYSDNRISLKFSQVADYWEVAKEAILEMHRQVGDLRVDENSIAQRGLIVRHLLLPSNLAGSFKIIDFIAEKLSKNTYINIMDQYRPCFKAQAYRDISRRITVKEYEEVVTYASRKGLWRGF